MPCAMDAITAITHRTENSPDRSPPPHLTRFSEAVSVKLGHLDTELYSSID